MEENNFNSVMEAVSSSENYYKRKLQEKELERNNYEDAIQDVSERELVPSDSISLSETKHIRELIESGEYFSDGKLDVDAIADIVNVSAKQVLLVKEFMDNKGANEYKCKFIRNLIESGRYYIEEPKKDNANVEKGKSEENKDNVDDKNKKDVPKKLDVKAIALVAEVSEERVLMENNFLIAQANLKKCNDELKELRRQQRQFREAKKEFEARHEKYNRIIERRAEMNEKASKLSEYRKDNYLEDYMKRHTNDYNIESSEITNSYKRALVRLVNTLPEHIRKDATKYTIDALSKPTEGEYKKKAKGWEYNTDGNLYNIDYLRQKEREFNEELNVVRDKLNEVISDINSKPSDTTELMEKRNDLFKKITDINSLIENYNYNKSNEGEILEKSNKKQGRNEEYIQGVFELGRSITSDEMEDILRMKSSGEDEKLNTLASEKDVSVDKLVEAAHQKKAWLNREEFIKNISSSLSDEEVANILDLNDKNKKSKLADMAKDKKLTRLELVKAAKMKGDFPEPGLDFNLDETEVNQVINMNATGDRDGLAAMAEEKGVSLDELLNASNNFVRSSYKPVYQEYVDAKNDENTVVSPEAFISKIIDHEKSEIARLKKERREQGAGFWANLSVKFRGTEEERRRVKTIRNIYKNRIKKEKQTSREVQEIVVNDYIASNTNSGAVDGVSFDDFSEIGDISEDDLRKEFEDSAKSR